MNLIKLTKFIVGTIFLLLGTLPAYALTVSLAPTPQVVNVGQTLQFDLVISGLGSGVTPSLGTYDVDISFDPGIFGFTSAVFGDPILGNQLDLFGLGSLNAVTTGIGTVNLFELSFDDPVDLILLQSENFTLATLSFAALSLGSSSLGIHINALGDEFGDPLTAQIVGASATVNQDNNNPIPEPNGLALVLAGLMVLVTVRASRTKVGCPV